jgi:ribosomal protein L22
MSDEDKQDKDTGEEAERPKRRRTRAKAKPAVEGKPAAEEKAGDDKPARPRARKKPEAKPAAAAKPAAEEAPVEEVAAEEPTRAPAKPAPARRRGGAETVTGPPVVRAHARYVRSSARKARLVCEHIRGKDVDEARAILRYAPRAVARDWSKLLESAVANAEHNHELVGDDLRIKEAFADEGPTLKRFRPRAMGRATPIRKRTSHLTITLTPKES